jgi:copper homeostasis protein
MEEDWMLEIIATTLEDARRIEEGGADRIELVSALSEGGLTPSYALIKNVVQNVNLPVNVMIRPHAKSFIYTEDEIKLMTEDILIAKELKVNGVVLGVLNEKNEIDITSLEKLLKVCGDIDVTFHRAIDELTHPVRGIELLTAFDQIKTVLTSGGRGNIQSNLEIIRNMVEKSKHIHIMVGGGLNFMNIKEIMAQSSASDYHLGTAVRDNNSVLGDIDVKLIQELRQTIGFGR